MLTLTFLVSGVELNIFIFSNMRVFVYLAMYNVGATAEFIGLFLP